MWGCTELCAPSTLPGCRAVISGWGAAWLWGAPDLDTSTSRRMVLGYGPGEAVPGRGGDISQGCTASMSLSPARLTGCQRCHCCYCRQNSLPSGRSALPRPDKVPQPERGWAPVWVWPWLGHCVKAGASAPSHGHCVRCPGGCSRLALFLLRGLQYAELVPHMARL